MFARNLPGICSEFTLKMARTNHARSATELSTFVGNPKYQPFWVSPLFYKALPRQFQPPECKLAPSKKGLAASNLQLLSRTTQKSPLPNLQFRGCQFAFWRLKLSWGCLIEKGGPPKRLLPWVSPHSLEFQEP